jgi:hypothetical protein
MVSILTYIIKAVTQSATLHIFCHILKQEWANKSLRHCRSPPKITDTYILKIRKSTSVEL